MTGAVCRLLDALSKAIETCELTLRMHAAASNRNPLQKLGYTMLIEGLLAAALLRHGEVCRVCNVLKLHGSCNKIRAALVLQEHTSCFAAAR